MNEEHQVQTESKRIEHYQDEIELIDYLRVIWKWKNIIVSGTIFCGLIAAIISFNMAKIYSIDMVLSPGILRVQEQGANIYIDTPQNIKALIESGIFDYDIINQLNDSGVNKDLKKLNFKVTIPQQSNAIKVIYETSDIKQGIVIQSHLSKLLLEHYSKLVKYFKNEYDMKLSLLESEKDYIKAAIQSYKRNVKNTEKRIDELMSEIELIKNNTTNLIKERNKLLSKNPGENNILSSLLYSNTIQQNLELSNNYQNENNEYKLKKEEELQNIEKSENEIIKKFNNIKSLQFKKDSIQNIQILHRPHNNPDPIKPNKRLNVLLSLVAGLFLMLFLAFLLEYLSRHKSSSR